MGKFALVTGGSGLLGRAIVRQLCSDGYGVAFVYNKRFEEAKALSEELGVAMLRGDLTDAKQVTRVAGQALDLFGSLDVLVNGVGLLQVIPFQQITAADWDAMLSARLKTMFLMTHTIVENMISRKKGYIINLGACASSGVSSDSVHHAAAGAAVSGFTQALADELGPHGIHVASIAEGGTEQAVVSQISDLLHKPKSG